jgi:hypothetical protein
MSVAFATIYGYIAVTAAGALLFDTLCRRGYRRATEVRKQAPQGMREFKQAA